MRPSVSTFTLVFVALAACAPPPATSDGHPADAAPIKVETLVAKSESVPRLIALVGTLKPNAESAVAANANGQVQRALVERGTRVAKGAALVVLDNRATALTAAEAQANLEAAKTLKSQADADCERNRRLHERRIITTAEFEKAEASCKVQTQSVAAAESRQKRAEISVGDSTVRAPFDGTVSERYVNVGEYVRADTKVAQIVQTDPLRVELTAGEADASAVHEGRTLRFQVKANPGKTYTGTVKYVAPSLRASTRDLVFEAVVPNPDDSLKAGMFVTAWLETGTDERVVVPTSALRFDGDTLRAFIVKDGRAEERVVHQEREQGERAVLGAGIAAGERVVVQAAGLKDGVTVIE
jgi:membrane fusion protein, multidrug efflux system